MFENQFNIISKFRGELMGIAIIGVCLLHAFAWAGLGDMPVCKALSPFARIAFTEGFLFLSGFGLYYSFSKNNDRRTFYKKRFNRVLFPYVIMGLPFFLYGLICGDLSITKFFLKVTSLYFWLFGNDGMWYISMSVALYALFPFAYKFMFGNQQEKSVLLRTLLLVVACVAVCWTLYMNAPAYYAKLEIGIVKTPMFFAGMLVGYYSRNNKNFSWKHMLGGGILLCLTFVLKKHCDFATPYYDMAYRLLMMPLACIVLRWLSSKPINATLQWFGKYSLEIYVLQMLVIGIVGQMLTAVTCSSSHHSIIQTLVTFSIVIGVCSPTHKCIGKLIKRIE